MSYVTTRGQLIARMEADRQQSTTTAGTFSKENARRYLDESWGVIYEMLTNSDTSYTLTETRITATTADTVALPVDFLAPRVLTVKCADHWVEAQVTSWVEVTAKGIDDGLTTGQGRYLWLRDQVGTSPRVEVLRFFPQLDEGQEVRLVYHRRPESLANTDGTYTDVIGNAEDSTIMINLYQATLVDVLVAVARARAANRADGKEYQLALAAAGDVTARLSEVQQRSRGPSRLLSSYATSRRAY